MTPSRRISRRNFLKSVTLASAASAIPGLRKSALAIDSSSPSDPKQSANLEEFSYGDVALNSALHERQLQETHAVLMDLSDDAFAQTVSADDWAASAGRGFGGMVPVRTQLRLAHL